MHAVHKILVNIDDCIGFDEIISRRRRIERIRDYAEKETESFYITAFDWRETQTAGRWSSMYPENVLLGKEDGKKLIRELKHCYIVQNREIEIYLGNIKNGLGDSITEIAKRFNDLSYINNISMDSYYLHCLVRLLAGIYYFDSGFYDTSEYTARINVNTIRNVKREPYKWAMVVFDYHY